MAASTSGASRRGSVNSSDSDIAGQPYAMQVKQLNDMITHLRALGAQAELDLPRIVVIGNQSAGKSSLIEAITKITVPRDQGTCTRCPMECRLSHSNESFRCQIRLRIENDELGNKVEDVREYPFGPALDNKRELEIMLRRAQLALLNPSVPRRTFESLDLNSGDPTEVHLITRPQFQFSANVICIDIWSPLVTNLSFIDLPGLISNVAGGEDRRNIELIENLVREHIEGNALILVTITMKDDISNQKAAMLAREVDPRGTRTIGVLTKPDTLQEGEHAEWLDILSGRSHHLTHGYFVTKQPSAAELRARCTYEDGREREAWFFENTSPWREAEPRIRQRMGVPRLTARLSVLLSQQIENTLPRLKEELRSSLLRTEEELKNLPPPPSDNPTAEILRLISDFSRHLEYHVRGLSGYETLMQDCRPAYTSFQRGILSTRPVLVPFRKDEVGEDLESLDFTYYASVGYSKGTAKATESKQDPIYLEDVRERINCSITRELPDNTPYQAKVQFVQEFFKDWKRQAAGCFDDVWNVYQRCLYDLIKRHFQKYKNRGLYDKVRGTIDSELQQARSETIYRIDWLLELEKDLFTQVDDYQYERNRIRSYYNDERQKKQCGFIRDAEDVINALHCLMKIGVHCCEEDLLQLGLGGPGGLDPYKNELQMMAETVAYFHIAYKRVIDNLPRIIDMDFIKGFHHGIHSALIRDLQLDEPNREEARRLLSEDPVTTTRRSYLEAQRTRHQEMFEIVNNFASLGI